MGNSRRQTNRAWANIRRKEIVELCLSPYLCRARNLLERFFNKIGQQRTRPIYNHRRGFGDSSNSAAIGAPAAQ
jgi:hypothetical protein